MILPVIDDTVNTLNYAVWADNINHHIYHTYFDPDLITNAITCVPTTYE